MNAQPKFAGLPDGVPALDELKSKDQWVAWKWVERNGRRTKPPVDPKTGRGASHSDPSSWGSYKQAAAFAAKHGLPGVGFVLADDDYTGIDLDRCIAADGQLEPWAEYAVGLLGETYAEISPSGKGLRLLARGKIDKTLKSDEAHVEIYRDRRYLTITGNHLAGTPKEIRPAPLTIEALVERVLSFKPASAAQPQLGVAKRDDFIGRVNNLALQQLAAWVPAILPSAQRYGATGAFRVSSADLGRDLQEDLSIAPEGIIDFGVHDMGDEREGKRTATDLVIEYGDAKDDTSAAMWLCERLGKAPGELGYTTAAEEFGPVLGVDPEFDAKVVEGEELARAALGGAPLTKEQRDRIAEAVSEKLREVAAVAAGEAAKTGSSIIHIGADRPFSHEPELMRDTLPEVGVGFIGGQSGAMKTFFALHLATCIMTGEALAGRKIERTGGIAYVAAEGESTLAPRLHARRTRLPDPAIDLPLYQIGDVCPLNGPATFAKLERRLTQTDRIMRKKHGVPLVAAMIDTVSAASMIAEDKENDPTAWQKSVFNPLQAIAKRLKILFVLVHHFGKSARAGLRGSSNNRAGADFVLALSCDRDEITGVTSNHFLALSKSRTATEGPIGAVKFEAVAIGQRQDGSEVTSLVLEIDDKQRRKKTSREKENGADRAFKSAIESTLFDCGHKVRPHGAEDAAEVMAAKLADVREKFAAHYVTSRGDEKQRADTLRKQFANALRKAVDGGKFCSGTMRDIEWVWPAGAPAA